MLKEILDSVVHNEFKNFKDIFKAVKSGKEVYWGNDNYKLEIEDRYTIMVHSLYNNSYIKLGDTKYDIERCFTKNREANIIANLNECRFDKVAITWSRTLSSLGIEKNSSEEVVAIDWLSDSKFTACSKCDVVCDSISEVKWSGHDFILKDSGKKERESWDCLCDRCLEYVDVTLIG